MDQNTQETYWVIGRDGRWLSRTSFYLDRLAQARPFFDKDAAIRYRNVAEPGAEIHQVWIESELDNAENA